MWTPASTADPRAWFVAWFGGPLWSEGPAEPCKEDSREATKRLAAEVVRVSVSKGCNDMAPDQVQSSEEESRRGENIHWKSCDQSIILVYKSKRF